MFQQTSMSQVAPAKVILFRVKVAAAPFVLGSSVYTPFTLQYYYHVYGYGQLMSTFSNISAWSNDGKFQE